jgi:hypothetical protein
VKTVRRAYISFEPTTAIDVVQDAAQPIHLPQEAFIEIFDENDQFNKSDSIQTLDEKMALVKEAYEDIKGKLSPLELRGE